jgi:hypothetical protein
LRERHKIDDSFWPDSGLRVAEDLNVRIPKRGNVASGLILRLTERRMEAAKHEVELPKVQQWFACLVPRDLKNPCMALGGVVWGSAASIAGASCTLVGAAVLFLTSLLLARRVSINFARNLEETVSALHGKERFFSEALSQES